MASIELEKTPHIYFEDFYEEKHLLLADRGLTHAFLTIVTFILIFIAESIVYLPILIAMNLWELIIG